MNSNSSSSWPAPSPRSAFRSIDSFTSFGDRYRRENAGTRVRVPARVDAHRQERLRRSERDRRYEAVPQLQEQQLSRVLFSDIRQWIRNLPKVKLAFSSTVLGTCQAR